MSLSVTMGLSPYCHPEGRTNFAPRSLYGVEGSLVPGAVPGVGVLRLRGCFAKRSSRSAEDDNFLYLQYHRHDQWTLLGLLGNVALQVSADFFLDHAVVGFLLGAGSIQSLHDDLPGPVVKAVFSRREAAGHDFGRSLHLAGEFVDGDDGQHDAVFTEVAAVFDNQVFDHVGPRSRVNADPADINAAGFARSQFVELENVAALDQNHVSDRPLHRCCHLRVQLQLPVLAVDGNEIFRLHQVDDQLQFFLAGVAADV